MSNEETKISHSDSEWRQRLTEEQYRVCRLKATEHPFSGTYNQSIGPPFLRKTESKPGSRVLAVIVVTKQGKVLYLKLAGPDKTVAAQAERVRQMIGADAGSEKPYALSS